MERILKGKELELVARKIEKQAAETRKKGLKNLTWREAKAKYGYK